MGGWLLLTTSLYLASTVFDLGSELDTLSLPFHQICLRMAPSSPHTDVYRAFVCGARLSNPEWVQALRNTGLLHLAVVSGSHLIFLEQILLKTLSWLRPVRHLVYLFLIVFTLVSRAEPPILRALFGISLRGISNRWRLQLTPLQITTICGLATVAFCRRFSGDHLSLLLSWSASLALAGFQPIFQMRKAGSSSLARNGFVYLLICPLLLPLAAPHPFSILCNWVFAPLLGALLFPLSLIAFLIPPAVPLIDAVWTLTEWVLKWVDLLFVPGGLVPIPLPIEAQWVYVVSLNALLLWAEHRHRRTR